MKMQQWKRNLIPLELRHEGYKDLNELSIGRNLFAIR